MLALTLSRQRRRPRSCVCVGMYVCVRERNESLAGEQARERSASSTDLGALLAEGATVEEALLADCAGCARAGVVILEGDRPLLLMLDAVVACVAEGPVLQTDVSNHGGLGRDVVVVVDAETILSSERFFLLLLL